MILAPLHLQPAADGLLYWGCLDCGAGQSSPDKPATAFDMLCRPCQRLSIGNQREDQDEPDPEREGQDAYLRDMDEDDHLVQERSDELQDQADKDAAEWRGSRDA